MRYLTAQQYAEITGAGIPTDFEQNERLAENIVDARTLYGFAGDAVGQLPEYVRRKLQEATAYQIQYIVAQGGLSGVNDAPMGSVSLGKFSYSTGANSQSSTAVNYACSPITAQIIPFLLGWLRGRSR